MQIIEEKELLNFVCYNFTDSNSTIFQCDYAGKLYAYKLFQNQDYLLDIIDKINLLGDLKIEGCLLPEYFVSSNGNIRSYLTKWGGEYPLYTIIGEVRNEIKIEILKGIKENLLSLHKAKIIHGDIHFGNILVDIYNLSTYLIDFDNCAVNNFEINTNICSYYAREYIKKYGVNEGLDNFLFNRLTFEAINDLCFEEVDNYILNGENKYFESNSIYNDICDTMLLNSNKPTDKFLIDCYQKKLIYD